MADARCPEPKPVTLALLTIAGALGGVAAACEIQLYTFQVTPFFWESPAISPKFDRLGNVSEDSLMLSPALSTSILEAGALMGAALGAAIAVSLALSRWCGRRAVLATLLGAASMLAWTKLCSLFTGGNPFMLFSFRPYPNPLHTIFIGPPAPLDLALGVGAPAALAMVLVHHAHLATQRWLLMLVTVPAIGALSFSLFWHNLWPHFGDDRIFKTFLVNGWLIGAVFGALQFAALVAARAIDRRMHRHFDPSR